jgi:apolipoprotein D and lipocalin family protein
MRKSAVVAMVVVFVSILAGCATTASTAGKVGPAVVRGFEASRYLGAWYEVARIDFTFEKGLDHTMANYSLLPDGSIRVRNTGRDIVSGKAREALGKARLRGAADVGALGVSFFGPFYADYDIIALDPDYQYALVGGGSPGFLWILSRTPGLPEAVRADYLARAEALGYEVKKLVWVRQGEY